MLEIVFAEKSSKSYHLNDYSIEDFYSDLTKIKSGLVGEKLINSTESIIESEINNLLNKICYYNGVENRISVFATLFKFEKRINILFLKDYGTESGGSITDIEELFELLTLGESSYER